MSNNYNFFVHFPCAIQTVRSLKTGASTLLSIAVSTVPRTGPGRWLTLKEYVIHSLIQQINTGFDSQNNPNDKIEVLGEKKQLVQNWISGFLSPQIHVVIH